MKKVNYLHLLIGACLTLFVGCDDDNGVDKSAVIDGACTQFVQCEGKLGYLSNYDADDVKDEIDGCNQSINQHFFANSKCNQEAAAYIECVQGLSCEEIHPVYISEGSVSPAKCNDEFYKFGTCVTSSSTGNGVYKCVTEDCYCLKHESICEWISDDSCKCSE